MPAPLIEMVRACRFPPASWKIPLVIASVPLLPASFNEPPVLSDTSYTVTLSSADTAHSLSLNDTGTIATRSHFTNHDANPRSLIVSGRLAKILK